SGAEFSSSRATSCDQTVGSLAVCGVAVAAAAWGFHRNRMKRAQYKFFLVPAERSRIARELHDTLAQGFAGIGFQLEAVAAKLTEAPAQAHRHPTLAPPPGGRSRCETRA